jgi:hypothetical protein
VKGACEQGNGGRRHPPAQYHQFALSAGSRPLPKHFVQRAAKILRPGWIGCLTLGNPVPSQAEHSISATAILGLSRFMNSSSGMSTVTLSHYVFGAL